MKQLRRAIGLGICGAGLVQVLAGLAQGHMG